MEITLKFIQTQLGDWDARTELNEHPNPVIRQVRLFRGGEPLRSGVLYFLQEGAAFAMPPESQPDCALVWTGAPADAPTTLPLLLLDRCGSVLGLAEEIAALIDRFRDWGEQVYRAALEGRSLDEVFSLLGQVTNNPWYLADNSFRMQAICKYEDMEDISPIWRYQYRQRHLPVQAVMGLVESGELEAANRRKHAFIEISSVFANPFVSKNIVSPSGIIGHLYIIGIHNKLSDYEVEIAEFFGNVISSLLSNNHSYYPVQGRFYESFFVDMVDGVPMMEEMDPGEVLRMLGWEVEDRFCLAVFSSQYTDAVLNAVSGTRVHMMERSYPCQCFSYHDRLAAVFNVTKLQKQDPERAEQRLEDVLSAEVRNYGGICGYSELFSGAEAFQNFHILYRQAEAAASFAEEDHTTLCSFHNVVVRYICRELSKTVPIKMIYHPAVSRLRCYDAENGSALAETLYNYIMGEQNTAQTARDMYIHRNSLLHRLERIDQLTGADLNDGNERLRILLSYCLPEP